MHVFDTCMYMCVYNHSILLNVVRLPMRSHRRTPFVVSFRSYSTLLWKLAVRFLPEQSFSSISRLVCQPSLCKIFLVSLREARVVASSIVQAQTEWTRAFFKNVRFQSDPINDQREMHTEPTMVFHILMAQNTIRFPYTLPRQAITCFCKFQNIDYPDECRARSLRWIHKDGLFRKYSIRCIQLDVVWHTTTRTLSARQPQSEYVHNILGSPASHLTYPSLSSRASAGSFTASRHLM